jgi:hypothetical protein
MPSSPAPARPRRALRCSDGLTLVREGPTGFVRRSPTPRGGAASPAADFGRRGCDKADSGSTLAQLSRARMVQAFCAPKRLTAPWRRGGTDASIDRRARRPCLESHRSFGRVGVPTLARAASASSPTKSRSGVRHSKTAAPPEVPGWQGAVEGPEHSLDPRVPSADAGRSWRETESPNHSS